MNEFMFTNEYKGGTLRQGGVGNESQERDRREKAIKLTSNYKTALERIYTPLVAKEYLSVLFRQRGVPSVDMFTREIIGSFRMCLGLSPDVDDVLRRFVVLGSWSNFNATVTMWTIEPVIASMCIRGNSVNVFNAREKYSGMIQVIEPLTMTTHMTTVVNNEIKGRWAGWLTWKEYESSNGGNPQCVSCNMCGPSIMFGIHRRGGKLIQMMMTPESIKTLSNYGASINETMGATATLIMNKSTRLKIQAGLDRPRSTGLTLYGNGSMQLAGSPSEIPALYPAMVELIKTVMDTEMVPFLSTLRRADTNLY